MTNGSGNYWGVWRSFAEAPPQFARLVEALRASRFKQLSVPDVRRKLGLPESALVDLLLAAVRANVVRLAHPGEPSQTDGIRIGGQYWYFVSLTAQFD